MKLTIIGTGYVGLVTGTCFAEVGHQVVCVDNDPAKVKLLQEGGIPIYEPGLEELVKKNVAAGRLTFTTSTAEGVEKSDVIFIAVPTPPQPDGSVDMSFLERVDESIRRSVVWRSLFRNPYPNDERSRAYAVMNNVFLHLHPVRVRQHAVKFAYTFCLGGLSFFLFLVLTVTGVYLMFFYAPSANMAYTNIIQIQTEVPFGLLTRNIHRWAAHLMVFFVFLHMMRVFYHGAYKPPREFNWVVGVVLLFLTIMLSFTGYLLPWDQIAYWAITIGTNMAGYAPLFNTPSKLLLLGGIEVGQNTLLRFSVWADEVSAG